MKTQFLLAALLLLLGRGADACGSRAPDPAPAPAAPPPAPVVNAHTSIECNQFERPALNCTGEASCRGYKCVCASNGHVYVPGSGCEDVDECKEIPGGACRGPKVTCQNAKGGYQCICDEEGHRYHPFKGCGVNNLCHFPFKYKETYYHHCIRSNHNRLWCSQTGDYDKDQKFINCASEFLTMHCHFPFMYNGKEYSACIGEGDEKWCATTYNYDSDRLWDICY